MYVITLILHKYEIHRGKDPFVFPFSLEMGTEFKRLYLPFHKTQNEKKIYENHIHTGNIESGARGKEGEGEIRTFIFRIFHG